MRWPVIIYGIFLAAFAVLLQLIEYQYLIRDLSQEAYVAAIAACFLALGLWAGLTWSRTMKDRRLARAFRVDEKKVQEVQETVQLSKRELEVLQLMAEGLSNQEIANRLFISLSTVKTHTSNLFTKLGVSRRTQAVRKAQELDFLVLD